MKQLFFYSLAISSGLILISSNSLAATQTLRPFRAIYTGKLHGISVGKATRILKIDPKKHRYLFTFRTCSTFPLVNLKSTEISKGAYSINGLSPSTYTYHYTLYTKHESILAKFNWAKGIVKTIRGKKTYSLKIKSKLQDKLSYQLALRQDLLKGKKELVYHIAGKREEHIFIFKRTGTEKLQTPLGKLETIKLEQSNRKGKNHAVIWVAPKKYNYLLVKIANYTSSGSISTEADIKSVKWL